MQIFFTTGFASSITARVSGVGLLGELLQSCSRFWNCRRRRQFEANSRKWFRYRNPPCRRRRTRSGFGEKMEKKLEDCLAALREATKESVSSSRGGGGSYDSDNLSLFVSDLSVICKELVGSSEEHTSFAVAIMFDEEIGVFSILECIMQIRDKSVAKAREDYLKFVEAFVKQIGGRALPHAAFRV